MNDNLSNKETNMNDNSKNQHHHSVRPSVTEMVRTLIGAFLGIGSIAVVAQFILNDADLTLVIGAFGASAVLVYGVPGSPLAQPYNVVVGHLVSAAVGVSVFYLIGEVNWLSASLAVSIAIVAMQMSRSVHPPGGASALIAVVATPEIHDLGFLFVIYPVGLGACILVGVGLITNNFRNKRPWPLFWY